MFGVLSEKAGSLWKCPQEEGRPVLIVPRVCTAIAAIGLIIWKISVEPRAHNLIKAPVYYTHCKWGEKRSGMKTIYSTATHLQVGRETIRNPHLQERIYTTNRAVRMLYVWLVMLCRCCTYNKGTDIYG